MMILRQYQRFYGVTIFTVILGSFQIASAQESDVKAKTVLDDSPWVSARAAGMGGALGGLADGIDAPYYNPAGIGNIHQGGKAPFIRMLNFPLVGVGVNSNSLKLKQEHMAKEAKSDQAITDAILNANAGKRQYARYSVVPSILLGRVMLAYGYDAQLAAVSLGEENANLIDTHYRVTKGPQLGFSITNKSERFYIGASASYLDLVEHKGQFTYGEIANPEIRPSLLAESRATYRGLSSNIGALWRLSKNYRPTVAIVGRNIGTSRYEPSSKDNEAIVVKENILLAFSISPKLGKWGYYSFTLEADKLSDDNTSIEKKVRMGMELTMGKRFGGLSGLGLKLGFNSAGVSGGMRINLGLMGLQLSSYGVDIGDENKKLIERRNIGMVSINLGEY